MNEDEKKPPRPYARTWVRTRLPIALAITLLPAARGDSRAPEIPGRREARGGDIHLARPTWQRQAIQELIREAAIAYGLDPALVRAVVWVESRYNPYAVSPRGARGLMQLTADTAREVGVTNPFDPRQNVFGGVKYLSRLIKRHDGDLALALASYNAGPETVRRFGGVPPFTETTEYLSRIRRRFRRLPEVRSATLGAPPVLGPPEAAAAPPVMD
jgi:soluble lytic murein transglycosylase-like protein